MPSKEKERAYLKAMQGRFRGFPTGQVVERENPDFLIDRGKDKVGIEITEAFLPREPDGTSLGSSGRPLQQQEAAQRQVLARARDRAAESLPLLDVACSFSPHYAIKNRDAVAEALLQSVGRNIPEPEQTLELSNDERPEHFSRIRIARFSILEQHHWSNSSAAYVQTEISEIVAEIIARKEQRLPDYLKVCDTCWLVIGSTGSHPSGLMEAGPATTKHLFRTQFDRVFFLTLLPTSITELHVEEFDRRKRD